MEGYLPLREVRRVGSQANRIIGEHFMGKGHLHCILRISLELKRTQWGNEELLHSFLLLLLGEGFMAFAVYNIHRLGGFQ